MHVHVCAHVCVCLVWTHVCTYEWAGVCVHMSVLCGCMWAGMHGCACMFLCLCAHVHTCMYCVLIHRCTSVYHMGVAHVRMYVFYVSLCVYCISLGMYYVPLCGCVLHICAHGCSVYLNVCCTCVVGVHMWVVCGCGYVLYICVLYVLVWVAHLHI